MPYIWIACTETISVFFILFILFRVSVIHATFSVYNVHNRATLHIKGDKGELELKVVLGVCSVSLIQVKCRIETFL